MNSAAAKDIQMSGGGGSHYVGPGGTETNLSSASLNNNLTTRQTRSNSGGNTLAAASSASTNRHVNGSVEFATKLANIKQINVSRTDRIKQTQNDISHDHDHHGINKATKNDAASPPSSNCQQRLDDSGRRKNDAGGASSSTLESSSGSKIVVVSVSKNSFSSIKQIKNLSLKHLIAQAMLDIHNSNMGGKKTDENLCVKVLVNHMITAREDEELNGEPILRGRRPDHRSLSFTVGGYKSKPDARGIVKVIQASTGIELGNVFYQTEMRLFGGDFASKQQVFKDLTAGKISEHKYKDYIFSLHTEDDGVTGDPTNEQMDIINSINSNYDSSTIRSKGANAISISGNDNTFYRGQTGRTHPKDPTRRIVTLSSVTLASTTYKFVPNGKTVNKVLTKFGGLWRDMKMGDSKVWADKYLCEWFNKEIHGDYVDGTKGEQRLDGKKKGASGIRKMKSKKRGYGTVGKSGKKMKYG